ncbi:SAM-dependent DNA methyltransferase [Salmonella enterica subsp. houtenae serovar 44:z36,[z38]:-]|uniref:SAM-dependent DNA methyltransferase n=1 Tax=Salmonella enterica subsp. houtenae serovar 44:z36[z38]:- TaxID=1967609 RepID=A0A736I1M8_SALHO|nr:N-6 DNA methylase [Salmonella enterica]EHM8757073.1 SAM-dependent DNA methyltransferase [Salmonella enterica subsp. houtenae serovar 44:z36,[z38]:-]HAE7580866.1 SAM-dependent DNA methyltransferase [Salmonella enterica subsp. houtenae serovar 44:z36[z38]:-]HCM6266661.1 SAM-dependent DNA methyltransferase [Salmonella enterica subsp. houtenae serovar 44:z36,Z38:-]EGF3877489.1 SAM-dependent DNA methyltransferase [Salmonella enterica]
MENHNSHIAEFISLFNQTARYHRRYEVFRDFVQMAACALHNGIVHSPELENEYLAIVKRHQREDVERLSQLLGILVLGLSVTPGDFLGRVFMTLELGESQRGQFFTPYDVSRMMAKMTLTGIDKVMAGKPFITVSEPACGAGGMAIALAEEFVAAGYYLQRQFFVVCVDVDPVAAAMCFIQLTLLGIPAEVITGNSLTLQHTRALRTAAYWLNGWQNRL